MRSTRHFSLNALFVIAVAAFMATTTTAQDAPDAFWLDGAGYRDTGLKTGVNNLSLAGGAQIFIYGTGMDENPELNTLAFNSIDFVGLSLAGPPLTGDDAFNSATFEGRLAYTTPTVGELFGTPIEDFNGLDKPSGYGAGIGFHVDMTNTVDGHLMECKTEANCKLHYSRAHTPALWDITPNQLYYNQMIQFNYDPLAAHTQRQAGDRPFEGALLGQNRIDLWDTMHPETNLKGYQMNFHEGYVGNFEPARNLIPRMEFRNGYQLNRKTTQHCNYAGDDCWTTRIVPTVSSVSQTAGYHTGGQFIDIQGYGLQGDATVTVDGVDCPVVSNSENALRCETSALPTGVASANVGVSQPGQAGIKRTFHKDAVDNSRMSFGSINDGTWPAHNATLYTSLEGYTSVHPKNEFGQQFKGFFNAPATGNYRFFMSCDDKCKLHLDTTPYNAAAPVEPTLTEIAWRNSASGWRDYFTTPSDSYNSFESTWVALTAGESYYLEAEHLQYTGGEHISVSVEIEDATAAGHPMASHAIQHFMIDQDRQHEEWTVTVTGGNGGTFVVNLLNPKTDPPSYWQSALIPDNAAWNVFRDAIRGYYSKHWGTWISVYKTDFDVDGVETTDPALRVSSEYKVWVARSIPQHSANAYSVSKATSNAAISVAPPSMVSESNTPLGGSYTFSCTDADGLLWTTTPMGYGWWIANIQQHISSQIPFLTDKIRVNHVGSTCYYRENCVEFTVEFFTEGVVPLCTIQSDVTDVITGDNPTFSSTEKRPYGQSLWFSPIGAEFLSAHATNPQVIVTVNDLQAACPDLSCEYVYEECTSTVETPTLTGVDVAFTIADPTLTAFDLTRVELAHTACESISGQGTNSFTCTLVNAPPAGTWEIDVRDASGIIPLADPATMSIDVPLTVTSVTPNLDLNQLGGDILTIAGTGFETVLRSTSVTFSDGTVCNVLTTSATEITCEVDGFAAYTADPITITVDVNGVTDASLTVTQNVLLFAGLSVSPSSVSPVLKTDIVITLGSSFTASMANKDDFQVYLIDDITGASKELYVISSDDTLRTLTVKFGGAVTGAYHLQVFSAAVGRVDKTPLALTVEGRVTSVSPQSGSVLGGTLLTIQGVNFSNDPLDNPVKVGDQYCDVITSAPTEITCRIRESSNPVSTTQVLVFLKTSEEAQCTAPVCDFEFVDPVPEVVSVATSFDSVSGNALVTVEGFSFPDGNTAETELYIDGVKQTTDSVTANSAVFSVTSIDGVSSSNVQIYFPDGIPTNTGAVSALTLTPALTSLSRAAGSAGGSTITVTGAGFGPAADLNLSFNGANVCDIVVAETYGEFTCTTSGFESTSADVLELVVDGTTYTEGAQNFAQELATSPTLDGASATASSLQFTGSNFPTAGFSAYAIFQGIRSSSAVINSDTSVDATFANGLPVADALATPVLVFVDSSNGDELYAVNSTPVQVDNPFTTATSTALQCSFAGGCNYSVTAAGLTSTLEHADNSLTVCGNECELDASSDGSTTVCKVPALATSYSVGTHDISEASVLTGTWFGTATDVELGKLTDGNNNNDMSDSSAGCHFGITFKTGQAGVIDEAKFFINNLIDKTPYIDGNLVLQGSNDGATWDDLWTVTEEIKEGWNAYNFNDDPAFTTPPAYNQYRFNGAVAGSCRVGEARFIGVEAVDSLDTTYSCPVKLNLAGVESAVVFEDVTYESTFTADLTSIEPRFGSVKGGTTVTFTGTGFINGENPTVLIDERPCAVSSATATEIVCVTADRPHTGEAPSLEILYSNGAVATHGQLFRYASLYSDPDTWGGDIPPIEGDSISIPKGQHLLVDVDSTEKLVAVIVEGSLIFPDDADPNHHRTFDAHYIMVNGGYFEAGLEDQPYRSKLTITMHSNVADPYLPIYGNKVIGVRFGQIEMHGITRPVTWTSLAATAEPGATSITLMEDPIDWAVGEQIVVASTNFDPHEAEKRTITSITGTTITFDEPFVYRHFAGVESFANGQSIEMRAEVGLLTRNIVYRGDPETSNANKYGAHIMIHSPGDESCIGRIEYVELTDVGQAFKLGRYPLHFHMIGTVHKSYVKGNAIHQTYNRAVTIHGVHYFRIEENVAYDTMGHTFFIEDAAETKNFLYKNLAIKTNRSWSLLNTDQTPASFWITHPDNIFRENHAAGSDRYGFWYDTQKHAMGPSFDLNVCPEGSKIGEFVDNVTHSNGRYGLRIFHDLIPRQFPCKPVTWDWAEAEAGGDVHHANPPIIAEFHNLISYKNGRNGAIAERVGAVQFHNFKTADNILAGIEFSLTEDITDGYAKIVGGVVAGHTSNTEPALEAASPHGIITPRTENFSVEGLHFVEYDFNNASGIGTCSHCFHDAATDSGARTVHFSGLVWDDATVPRRIRYQFPFRAILADKDSSLTGLGANTWATPFWLHNEQPECTRDDAVYDGLICDNTVQVRRIAFHGAKPTSFMGMAAKVLRYDAADEQQMITDGTLEAYLEEPANYAKVPFKAKLKPMNGWAIPFVTNHRYKIHWAEGLDFTQLRVEVSERWQPTDHQVNIVSNHTDVREAIEFYPGYGSGALIENLTLSADSLTGDNIVLNATEKRTFEFAVNGKDKTRNEILIKGIRCVSNCLSTVEDLPIEDSFRYWSDPNSWDSGELPKEGEDVEIQAGWNMVFDLEESPILQLLQVNGRLSFGNPEEHGVDMDMKLHAHHIFVRAGELIIGSKDAPHQRDATIVLHGRAQDAAMFMDNAVEAGNKVLANLGDVAFYGKPRSQMARLRGSVSKNAEYAMVDFGLDWVAGDQIFIAPSTSHMWHGEYRTITAYDPILGRVDFDTPLEHYHYGDISSTADDYSGVDMRTEVVLLTRNVKVVGDDVDAWGGHIVTSETLEFDGTQRAGQLIFENVQVYNCSHRDTYKAAVRFEGAITRWSHVKDSVIHNGLGWGLSVQSSSNVKVEDTAVIGFRAIGSHMDNARNVTFDGVFTGDVQKRELAAIGKFVDKEGCVAICSYHETACTDISVVNSIAAGCPFGGFVAPGHECGEADTQTVFRNNVAHSVDHSGIYIYPPIGKSWAGKCYEGSHFSAYKNRMMGVTTQYATQEVRISYINSIDNTLGSHIQIGKEGDNNKIVLSNWNVYGETAADDCPPDDKCWCQKKYGIKLHASNVKAKDLHPTSASALPIQKIKSYGAWHTDVDQYNFKIFNFDDQTKCGAKQRVFGINKGASDYVPLNRFHNTLFSNVADSAMAHIFDPVAGWANPTDCGEWPCTAPSNIVAQFEGTQYNGLAPIPAASNWQFVSDMAGTAENYDNCRYKDAWNAWHCQNSYLGVLQYESLDGDTMDRSVQPIIVTNEATGYNNKINSMMDHVWDGFYTGQLRMSRFPTQIEAQGDYTVQMTGTPPGSMRYRLNSDRGAIKIKVPYPNAGAYSVYVNGNEIAYTPWDEALGRHAPLTKRKGCGENRFVGIENFLEFYLVANCEVTVRPRDAIMTSVRMEWTLDEFYADGGVVSFTDRVAAALGIHASTIKTVAVYEGSVVVQFFIEAPAGAEEPQEELAAIKSDLTTKLESNTIDLGAPVLDAITDGDIVIRDGVPASQWTGSTSTRRPSSNTSTTTTTSGSETVKEFSEATQENAADLHETITEVVYRERAAAETGFKYPIIILAILAAVLVAILMVVLVKTCCAKKPEKLQPNRLTQTDRVDGGNALEPQFHPDDTENKANIFARAPVDKANEDAVQDASVDLNHFDSASKSLGEKEERPKSTQVMVGGLPEISE